MNSYGLSLVGEMLVAVWDGGDRAMEACDSFEVLALKFGEEWGDGLLS